MNMRKILVFLVCIMSMIKSYSQNQSVIIHKDSVWNFQYVNIDSFKLVPWDVNYITRLSIQSVLYSVKDSIANIHWQMYYDANVSESIKSSGIIQMNYADYENDTDNAYLFNYVTKPENLNLTILP